MQTIVSWLDSNPTARYVFITLLLAVFSMITNWMLRLATPEAWESLKKDHPRMAAAISLLRAIGIDPVKMINAIESIIRGKWNIK